MLQTLHPTVETFLVLLLVVFVVAAVAQRVRLPYTVALVAVGFLGFRPGFLDASLTPDLILLVFLPVMLFEGAYNVPAARLWQNALPITLLAVPGMLIATAVTGAITHAALGLSLGVALLFGALISSTDPIAVVSMFREVRAPRRLALLVEGESLFNDGTAITLVQIILIALVAGKFGISSSVARFVVTVAGALVVGGAIGYIGSRLLRAIDITQIQIAGTVVAAYGAYLLAEALTVSGAIAVVVAGLFFGNYGSASGLSPRSVHALGTTWEFLGFVANSLVFLLIGIALDPLTIARYWWAIAIAFVASLAGRALGVMLLMPLVRGGHTIPARFLPVLVWGGLRGAVSLALVLSIPLALPNGRAFPDRSLLEVIAFGVVGASLLQGLTMAPLLRRLGLQGAKGQEGAESAEGEVELLRARLAAVEGALLALSHEHDRGELGSLQYARLSGAYKAEHGQLERQLRKLAASERDQE